MSDNFQTPSNAKMSNELLHSMASKLKKVGGEVRHLPRLSLAQVISAGLDECIVQIFPSMEVVVAPLRHQASYWCEHGWPDENDIVTISHIGENGYAMIEGISHKASESFADTVVFNNNDKVLSGAMAA